MRRMAGEYRPYAAVLIPPFNFDERDGKEDLPRRRRCKCGLIPAVSGIRPRSLGFPCDPCGLESREAGRARDMPLPLFFCLKILKTLSLARSSLNTPLSRPQSSRRDVVRRMGLRVPPIRRSSDPVPAACTRTGWKRGLAIACQGDLSVD